MKCVNSSNNMLIAKKNIIIISIKIIEYKPQ